MKNNNNQHFISLFGVRSISSIEHIALPYIATTLDEIQSKVDALDQRISTIEAAEATNNKDSGNEDIKNALMDAHNALELAISFFKRTAKENKR